MKDIEQIATSSIPPTTDPTEVVTVSFRLRSPFCLPASPSSPLVGFKVAANVVKGFVMICVVFVVVLIGLHVVAELRIVVVCGCVVDVDNAVE